MHLSQFEKVRILAALLFWPAWNGASAKEAEYHRADPNLYLQNLVLKAEPSAIIVDSSRIRQEGPSYFLKSSPHPAREIYISATRDWLEPITPPSMPASLDIDPNAMQIREPQGDVQVASPTQNETFVPATDGMTIPNGTVIRTGANGTAAVLFGGVNSARLSPHSEATVQQTIDPQLRTTRIDLRMGAVFSKVGLRAGEQQDYQVHTPFGFASAKGTDFASVLTLSRVDVWIVQGTVQLEQPNGPVVGVATSTGKGNVQMLRFPPITDAQQALEASAETLTAALNFIPTVNLKVEALHKKIAQGTKLTIQERKYLSLIKEVPSLIELVLIPPVAPSPAIVPPPSHSPPAVDPSPLKTTLSPPQRATSMKRPPVPVAPVSNGTVP